jgi:acetyltransferase-like isoleucine patch superfamily enzyme
MNDKSKQFRFDDMVADQSRNFLQKYQDAVIGNRRITTLIKYELLMLLVNPFPGAIGLGLRKVLFPGLFGSAASGIIFGHNLSIRSPGNIHIGSNSMIDDYVMLSHRGSQDQYIKIGDNCLVGRYTQIHTRGGNIDIRPRVNISSNCFLVSANELSIGEHTLIGGGCYIGGLQHNFSDPDKLIIDQGVTDRGGVHIGKDCWLGAHVMINDGITIGDGCVIGSGSVVTRDIPAYSVALGSPAKVIRERSSKEHKKAAKL